MSAVVRASLQVLIIAPLMGVALHLPRLFVHAFCITGWGLWSIPADLMLVFPAFCAAVLLISSLVRALMRRNAATMLACSAGTIIYFITLFPGIRLGMHLRDIGFDLAAQRAQPLVQAIHRYEDENGAPPRDLAALVPNYLPELPTRLPPLKLHAGKNAWPGNSWHLVAAVSTGVLNWDEFFYLPSQNYPDRVQRVRDWAYYHE